LFWLAECEEIAYHEVFDATYTWTFLHKMEAVWRKEVGLAGLDEVLHNYAVQFPAGAIRAYFTTNHDENSHSGSEYERMGDAALAFEVLCCTWDGVPLIYSGQEMPNYKRLKFFDKDPIEWTGRYELHDFYKALLTLRKRHAAVRGGDVSATVRRLHTSVDDRCFAFARAAGEDVVLVVLNFSGGPLRVDAGQWGAQLGGSAGAFQGTYRDIFTGAEVGLPAGAIELKAWGYSVLEKK
jgi:glycosidase